MANSSGGNSGNRRPKGSGNRSASTARRSGSPAPRQPTVAPAEEFDDEAEATKSADERARERLANRPAAKKGGGGGSRGSGGGGGSRKGPPSRGRGGRNQPGRNTGRLAALISSGVVAVFVVVIVLISTLGGSSGNGKSFPLESAPASLVAAVTHIPASSFATADTGGGEVQVSGELDETPDQPAVTSGGLPELVYVGAEGCPYCAAARWPLLIALSRFGTFSNLGIIKSSPADSWANTNTFSFVHSTYKSAYIVFDPTEEMNNVPCTNATSPGCTGGSWHDLQTPTAQVEKLSSTYDSCKYFPNTSTPGQCSGIPFMDWGGKYVSSGGWYLPTVINPVSGETAGQGSPYSWTQIAQFLTVPSQGEGEVILAAANVYTALICDITSNKDAAVCNTSEVKNANKLITDQQKIVK
ncbi:MAG TPA: DUF929 family protein [Acidimicrobiales bacterium]|jgi:hypothetical protein|nr:DUF929 family protein [Acidimicrobiales bacterium]